MRRGSAGRPQRLAGALALCVALGALGGCAGAAHDPQPGSQSQPARAVPADTVGEFGRQGTGAGEFQEPFGIGVDRRKGDMYVVDTNHVRIEKFTRSGRFLLAWGWGVADGRTRALQTCRRRCFAGLAGTGAGQFDFPEGAAVDNDPASRSRGDVYTVDIRNGRIQKFSPAGRFLLMFGGGVNHSARRRHSHAQEDVCPVRRGDVCGKGIEGPAGARLEMGVEGSFIAVAPDATVYVGQRNSVKTFAPDGSFRARIALAAPAAKAEEGREAGSVSALAVDRSGRLYVVRHGVAGVNEYTSTGQLIRTLDSRGEPAYAEGPTPSLALDPAGNVFIDVYAQYLHRIDEYSSSGAKLATFDWGTKALPGIADKEDGLPGMAYNEHTGKLYLVNADVNVKPVVERVRIVTPPRP